MQDYLQYVQSEKYKKSHLQQDEEHFKEVQESHAKPNTDKFFQRFHRRIAIEPSQVQHTTSCVVSAYTACI